MSTHNGPTISGESVLAASASRPRLAGESPQESSTPVLFATGFRPFFLAAALHAALVVPVWIACLNGLLTVQRPLAWHAHEMVFGFVAAVIAGFLLTAVVRWTGQSTLTGGWLLALVGCWAAGRAAPFLPGELGVVGPLALDGLFWAGLWVGCARPIWATKSRRNYGILALVLALGIGCCLSHAERWGFDPLVAARARLAGVDLVVTLIVVMSGRVVPMFTRNATGAPGIQSSPALDRVAISGTAALAVLQLLFGVSALSSSVALGAGVVVLVRSRRWGARASLTQPLLWVLHVGHASLGLGLVLRGVAFWWPSLSAGAALHAVTVGGIALICLGMMARVSLGHTGRMLVVSPLTTAAFALLVGALVARVVGPLVVPAWTIEALTVAAALWSAAFVAFLIVYTPVLVAPRADGRPG